MDADLDLLLSVFCTADDFLPAKPPNARRIVSDAEVVTLCVAQAIMGITSDPRFAVVATKRLPHLFPRVLEDHPRQQLAALSALPVGVGRGGRG